MRYKVVSESVGIILTFLSISFIVPILIGLIFDEDVIWLLKVFGLPALLTAALGLILIGVARGYSEQLRDREAFTTVAGGWLIFAFFGSLPYILSGTITDPISAYFESMSGFATVGSTVITNLKVVPKSVLMWRSLTQWMGGMGIIVLSIVVLARVMGRSAAFLFKAEVAGHTITRLKPKIAETARTLWLIYLIFTLTEFFLLWIAGMTPFDAINHSMTTLATGGFGTHDESIGYYNSILIEGIIITFIIIGSTNFVLLYQASKGNVKVLLHDAEFRFYMLVLALATTVVTADLALHHVYNNVFTAFRYSIFQVVSMAGTCGFTNANFGTWPPASQFILVILMLMGGSAGSTAGAIKMVRILVLFKLLRREVHQVIHPRAVIPIKIGSKIVPEEAIKGVTVFFAAYIITFIISSALLTLTGLDIITATTSVITAMGGVGPGLGKVVFDFTAVGPWGKILLSLDMWLGRLELFAGFVLFFPSNYEK